MSILLDKINNIKDFVFEYFPVYPLGTIKYTKVI